ncbi:DUF2267 domain-containing protein [Pseudohoeflea coraliihabitans]|uniref:DUF2780 domain-containing protein n=1 Tax=Pseudohoeflea coraliihabitans TaxID=2860393 RepID=A0ABS6WRM5_9HYPH|nr:DUF2267 domain-containing protein [Pseudohoeflea sp. DP4N28-3]MBW3098614.1 DUF2780 domain-containing protein [Pseudohoeflea sp. DP4N28-3]
MEELIKRIEAAVGIDAETAQKAVGAILNFLKSEGPDDKVQEMLAALPGADVFMEMAAGEGGGMGSLMGGGVMGLGSKLMGMGLDMGQISSVAKETVGFAREKGAGGAVDDIVNSIPGLSQFV